jgi:hypothetical protein
MRQSARVVRLMLLGILYVCPGAAGSITVGSNNGGNAFPFGGPASGFAGTEYQEAYASSNFSTGPIIITGINFFRSGGSGPLYSGTYQLSLSTITANINSLSDTNFSSNLGPNNALFATTALSGVAPNVLGFAGTPFYYDPATGNLLLDIQVSNGGPQRKTSFFQDGSGSAVGTARYHNFGIDTAGFGLVTQFNYGISVSLPGGTLVNPVMLTANTSIGQITSSIGGSGSQDYYSFLWNGGDFSATAAITGANAGASYLFSEGAAGTCSTGGSVTLNSGDGFAGTISVPNLAPGQYCIGINANNPNDPNFSLTFNTPVSGVPEPATFGLFSGSLGIIGVLRRIKRGCVTNKRLG